MGSCHADSFPVSTVAIQRAVNNGGKIIREYQEQRLGFLRAEQRADSFCFIKSSLVDSGAI